MVVRHAPRLSRDAASIVPVTVTGPMRLSSTGAATASVRSWASEKPAAKAASAISAAPPGRPRRTNAAAIVAPDTGISQCGGSRGSAK